MARTSIEWTADANGAAGMSWNIIRGCARVSDGCTRCYAERQAHRFSGKGKPYEGLTVLGKKGPRWTGEARFVPSMLELPLRTRKPTKWFVNSMSDIAHPDISFEQIAAIFGVMASCPDHTFQLLTKRPERLVEFFAWVQRAIAHDCELAPRGLLHNAIGLVYNAVHPGDTFDEEYPLDRACEACCDLDSWPLPNVWIGVSVEDQCRANERIPLLLQIPAAVRWLSVEPLLEHVGLDLRGIDWVVVGGESGPGARQCNVDWIRDIVRQCRAAEVSAFVKQLGAAYRDEPNAIGGAQVKVAAEYGAIRKLKDSKGADLNEWPADLRVREFPTLLQPTRCVAGSLEADKVEAGGEDAVTNC